MIKKIQSQLTQSLSVGRAYFSNLRQIEDRYVRRIKVLRVVLPASIVVLGLGMLLWTSLFGSDRYEAVSSEKLGKKPDVLMTNPKYSGHDENGKPYSLQAVAVRDNGDKTYKLDKPSADLQGDDGWMTMRSAEGKFNEKEQKLDLSGNVTLYHNQGHEFNIDHVTVDFEQGKAVGNTPVRGQTPEGSIKAEGLEIHDQGDKVIFMGESELVIRAQTKDNDKAIQ